MINVKDKTCIYEGCNIQPNFNFPNEKTPLYCLKHKEDDMIDIRNKQCIIEGCNIRPHYNLPGEKTAIYCNAHKQENMINIISKTCIYKGCNIRPSYNYLNEKITLYCFNHKLNDMIDVINPICSFKDCNIRPNFNLPGEKTAIYCTTHKKDDMIDINHSQCFHKGCIIRPNYNYSGEKTAIYCLIHKEDNMINIKHKQCTSCGLSYKQLYNNLCINCNPEKQKIRIRKEQIVSDLLELKFPNHKFIRDKSSVDIKICTGKYIRPDFVLNLDDRVIIVEVDEHQHESYAEDCEVTRLINISMSYGGSPVIWFRFNPDAFKIDGKTQSVSSKMRLNQLVELIQKYISFADLPLEELKKLITVEYLFYDDDRQKMLEELTESYMKNYK